MFWTTPLSVAVIIGMFVWVLIFPYADGAISTKLFSRIVIGCIIAIIVFALIWTSCFYESFVCDRCGREMDITDDSGMCWYCEQDYPLCDNCGHSYIPDMHERGLCGDCEN